MLNKDIHAAMNRKKILIVDDEKDIVSIVKYNLEEEGFAVMGAYSGGSALDMIDSDNFDLLILDIMLPGMDGYGICRKIKGQEKTKHIPIIMLTVKSGEKDIVKGLRMGADDYVTKPFSVKVLVEKVKAVLRRSASGKTGVPAGVIGRNGIEIDPEKYTVSTGSGEPSGLGLIEFNILRLFLENPGRVFSREELSGGSCSGVVSGKERSVDVHIAWLRRKLKDKGSLIETVRGIGYRFKETR